MDYEFTEPSTQDEWDEYYRLRYERLRKPLGLPPGSEREDPAEASSLHTILKDEDRVVAGGCWVLGMAKDENGARMMIVRFRQMAVDPEYEGRGIGSALMRYVEQRSREVGAAEILGNVRVENAELFRRHGYLERGDGVTLYGQVESLSMYLPLR